MKYNFEWDPKKAKLNQNKHKTTFEQATTVFNDPYALSIFDEEHSDNEERWLTQGIAADGKLLIVSHTYRQMSEESVMIRITSGRKATKREQQYYREGL